MLIDRLLGVGAVVVMVVCLAVVARLVFVGADQLGSEGDDPEIASQIIPTAMPPVATAVPTSVSAEPTAEPADAPAADPPVVCIDVGHGGVDEGKLLLSDDGSEIVAQEKDFTLAQSLALRDRLEDQGVAVVLTRETDTEVNATFEDVNGDGEGPLDPNGDGEIDTRQGEAPNELDELQARVNICNDAGADLLISVHINGAENLGLKGYEAWWAEGYDYSEDSQRIAELLTGELGAEFADAGYETVFRGAAPDSALDPPDKVPDPNNFNNFVLLSPDVPGRNYIGARMPSVIVECLFLSNEDDAAFLVGEADVAQNAIVTAYETAILEYFEIEPTADANG